jgi:hypothetical protein
MIEPVVGPIGVEVVVASEFVEETIKSLTHPE